MTARQGNDASPPTFGRHEPVAQYGQRLGGAVEIYPGVWIPACIGCYRRLAACSSKSEAIAALRIHWAAEHTRRRAA